MKFFKNALFSLIFLVSACQPKSVELSLKVIESIILENIKTVNYQANTDKGIIVITVPYNTYLKKVKPIIKISEGASIVPASGTEQDFTKSVIYTVTGQDGNKAIFTVSVIGEAQPLPIISNFDKDTLEAGQSFVVTGKNFGTFGLDLKAKVVNASNQTYDVESELIDSSKVKITLPFGINPDVYKVSITNKTQTGISTKSLVVQYPSPQITAVSRQNLRQSDTIVVSGNYLKPSAYQYEALLVSAQKSYNLKSIKADAQKLTFIIADAVLPADYKVQLLNVSEKKRSRETGFSTTIYDKTKPFLGNIINKLSNYQAQQAVVFNTYNFAQTTARFYQCQIYNSKDSYFQNGIYDSAKQRLSLTLPTNIKAGDYAVAMRFLSSNGDVLYEIATDERLGVK